MRAFITALMLFSIIISVIVINSIYISSVSARIDRLAEQISTLESKADLIDELKDIWKKNLPIFNLSIRMGELERMSDLIESLEASYNAQNDAELQKCCTLISDLAKELSRHERLSLRGIF